MSLIQGAQLQPSQPASAVRRAIARAWPELNSPVAWLVMLILVIMPLIANGFFLIEIFGTTLILGIVALSLMFLAGYGGMVSLMQLTIAGFAAYMVAVIGMSANTNISLGWPWWIATPMALALATLFGTLGGALAVRTEGIYTIMITLAIGAAFYYFTNQNWAIFGGHTGINTVATPHFLGVELAFRYPVLLPGARHSRAVLFRGPVSFARALRPRSCRACATIRGAWPRSASMSTRTGWRPMRSRRSIAGLGGVLQVWNYRQISPGSVSVNACIDILIIAVVGGITRPIGPFIGAFIFVMLRTFALDFLVKFGLDGNRFRLLIGLGFLAIVFWSSDGVVGLWEQWRRRFARAPGPAGWKPPGKTAWIAPPNACSRSAPAQHWNCAA